MAWKPSRSTWIFVALTLTVAASFYLLGEVFRRKDMSAAADLAQLLSYPLALLAPTIEVVRWRLASRRPTAVTPSDLNDLRDYLAMLMAAQWKAESRIRALDDPDPIAVPWALTVRNDVMDRPDNLQPEILVSVTSGDIGDLVERFRALRRPRLVISGGVGTGKTTLAVQILLRLLATRKTGDPVPVLLSVAGWEATANVELEEWLVERIVRIYPDLASAGFGPRQVREASTHRMILPVLDGLDEATPDARGHIIDALNRWMDGEAQLILTCRSEEFAEATSKSVLRSTAVIEPQHLTSAVAADYLDRCLPPSAGPLWSEVIGRLRADRGPIGAARELADVAATPLGLWLIRAAYISPQADPDPLLDDARFGKPGALRAHLFDRLIPAIVATRLPSARPFDPFRPRQKYAPDDVDRWLRFIATNMNRLETRELDLISDVPLLAAPALWPARLVRALSSWSLVLCRSAIELIGRNRWMAAPIILIAALMAFGVGSAAFVLMRAALSVPFPGFVASPLAVMAGLALPAALLLICVAPLVFDSDEFNFTAEQCNAGWYRLRARVMKALPMVTYAAAWYALVGGVSGMALYALQGYDARRVAFIIGAPTVTALAALLGSRTEVLREEIPLGGGWRAPWYGWSPRVAFGRSLTFGLFVGAVLGLLVSLLGDKHGRGWLAYVEISILIATVTTIVLISIFAILLPTVHGFVGAIEALMRLLFGRNSRLPPPTDPDRLLRLWRFESFETKLRLMRATLLCAVLSVGGVHLWHLVHMSREWHVIQEVGISAWLGNRFMPFDVHWRGHLGYVLAATIAAIAIFPWVKGSATRRWILWIVASSTIAVGLRRYLPSDIFRLRLTGIFDGNEAKLGMSITASLGDRSESYNANGFVDLAGLIADNDVRTVANGALVLLAIAVLVCLVVATEGWTSRIWWSVTVTSSWHRARGRMPADLPAFLEDAHSLGLLRAVGTSYQFRHADFQDHLASKKLDQSEE